MSSNNVAHIASVDKGLKMKIKRTKGPNRVDSKHEVVKSDSLSKPATPSSGLSSATLGVTLPTSSTSLSTVGSNVTTSGGTGSSVTFMFATSVTSSLTLPTSAPLPVSSSSSSTSPCSSLIVPTPGTTAVSLLKSGNAGITSDGYSGNNMAVVNKSPLKTIISGSPGADPKEGKSPKTKAAYNKKIKDNKVKADGLVTIGPSSTVSGLNLSNIDMRNSIGVTSNSQTMNSATAPFMSQAGVINSTIASEPRPGDTVHMKRENPVHDPYEFNAKVEDKIELPPKKLKLEKADCIETAASPQPQPQQHASPAVMLHPPPPPKQQQQQQQQQQPPHKRSVGVDVRSVGVLTEPDSLGPCEPGTQVGLEGIVWKETDNGLLVVNVTWRGKTYVGTLMDATRYAWAPPRPNGCESPVSDFESRTPKGRGKRNCRSSVQSSERLPEGRRLRKGRRGTVNSSSSNFTAPPSPAKSDISTSNMKRKTKPNDVDSEKSKRSRSCSRGVTGADSPTVDGYIVCPEPNCHKKYKHMNGLRYHRTHAHRKSSLTDDAKDDEEDEDEEEDKQDKKEKATVSDRADRIKAKGKQRTKEQPRTSDRDSKDSLDDDIPLKEIANKASGQTSVHKVDVVNAKKDGSEEESSGSGNDMGSDGTTVSTTVNSKIEPQIVLTKTDIHLQKESESPTTACVTSSKKKDSNLVDVPMSKSSSVPSVSSTSESSLPLVVNSTNSHTNLPVVTTTKSQVGNFTPASSAAGVTHITQTCPNLTVVTAQAVPLMTSASGQASTTSTSVLGVTMTTDRQIGGKSSSFIKSITSARPIVPAPSPQMAGVGNTHSQNNSSLSSVQGHGSTLKPIQPKPTILGDYSVLSPSLSDLNKEKMKKSKKKKDNAETATSGPVNPGSKCQVSSGESNSSSHDMNSHDDLYKCERTAVIRSSNPSKPYEASSPSNDISKLPFQSSLNSHNLQYSVNSDSPLTGRSRIAIPPSTLPVVSSADGKSTVNDDVHSPAYSDISDANDSNSPMQQDSPKKESSLKKDGQVNGPQHLGSDTSSLSQHFGNMFYYGGPQNYLPHGISPQIASPTLSDGLIKKDDMEEKRPSSSNENPHDKKEGARCVQETDLQQKSLINYFAHLHGMSPAAVQLQYNLGGYNPMTMDSSYAMLPQQSLDQQKRLLQHHELAIKAEDGSGKRPPSGTPSTTRSMGSGFEFGVKLNAGIDRQLDQKRSSGDQDQTLRGKHNGNHQVLKENIELKSQMGLTQDQHNYQLMKQQQQQNDLLRAQIYQQQKQKMYENQHQDKRKSPPEFTNTGSLSSGQSSGAISRNSSEMKPLELIPHDMIKKEVIHSKDISRLDGMNLKRFDIKEENTQSGPSSSSFDRASKSRSPSQSNTPNIPQASSTHLPSSSTPSSLLSSVAASLPVTLVNSLPAAGAAFPYAPYYQHFRPMQLDTMYRAISPHIIGYTNNPHGYIHQTQLGYRMPIVDTDGKSPDSVESLRGDGPGLVTSAGYASSHKINELHDKGRPSPGVHSAAPAKSGSGDNMNSSGSTTPSPAVEKVKDKQREYSSSPPTQRHVHTHHHTHVVSGFPPLYTPDAYS